MTEEGLKATYNMDGQIFTFIMKADKTRGGRVVFISEKDADDIVMLFPHATEDGDVLSLTLHLPGTGHPDCEFVWEEELDNDLATPQEEIGMVLLMTVDI